MSIKVKKMISEFEKALHKFKSDLLKHGSLGHDDRDAFYKWMKEMKCPNCGKHLTFDDIIIVYGKDEDYEYSIVCDFCGFDLEDPHRKYDRIYHRKKERELRAKIFEMLGNKCEYCGSTENLEIHHWHPFILEKGGVKEREERWVLKHLDDVSLLCKKCHDTIHWAFRKLDKKDKP